MKKLNPTPTVRHAIVVEVMVGLIALVVMETGGMEITVADIVMVEVTTYVTMMKSIADINSIECSKPIKISI